MNKLKKTIFLKIILLALSFLFILTQAYILFKEGS